MRAVDLAFFFGRPSETVRDPQVEKRCQTNTRAPDLRPSPSSVNVHETRRAHVAGLAIIYARHATQNLFLSAARHGLPVILASPSGEKEKK